ncbi:MAG: pantoate--beta-alanine ligase, partial [Sphingopyxis sp.]|nr:pantoate--beta-alanine ligase [Sphingopyxis sp.]
RSSRNAYLSAAERGVAAHLPRVMADTVAAIVRSAPDDADAVAAALAAGQSALLAAGFDSLDYFDLRDGASLQSCATATPGARLFVAARIGRTRLIDNIAML